MKYLVIKVIIGASIYTYDVNQRYIYCDFEVSGIEPKEYLIDRDRDLIYTILQDSISNSKPFPNIAGGWSAGEETYKSCQRKFIDGYGACLTVKIDTIINTPQLNGSKSRPRASTRFDVYLSRKHHFIQDYLLTNDSIESRILDQIVFTKKEEFPLLIQSYRQTEVDKKYVIKNVHMEEGQDYQGSNLYRAIQMLEK